MAEIILPAILSLTLLILGAFKGAKDKEKIKMAIWITVIGVASFIVTIYFSKQNSDKKIHQKAEITKLNDELLKNQRLLEEANNQIETLLTKQKINNKPVFKKYVQIDAQESIYINGLLREGMKVVVTQSNCSQGVVLMHKNTPYSICQSDDCEINIEETGMKNSSFFVNQGRSPCGMMISIFSSPDDTVWVNNISLDINSVDPTLNPRKKETYCSFEDLETKGEWQLTKFTKKCNNRNEWNEKLTTFFKISKFYNDIEKGYCLEGYKYGEDFGESYKRYSKESKISLVGGKLQNCELKISLPDTSGYYIFNEVKYFETRTKLYGEFYSSVYGCSGFLELTSIKK